MKNQFTIQEWEEMYRTQIEEVYLKVLHFIRTVPARSIHITKVYVNEDDLYDQLVEHMYDTSNNKHKNYCH